MEKTVKSNDTMTADDFDFPAQELSSPSVHLVVVDCESKRFTIEGPIATACLDTWYKEVDRASFAGRWILCVPMTAADPSDAMELVSQLGYDRWPPQTIISPQRAPENKSTYREMLPARERNYLLSALVSKRGNIRRNRLYGSDKKANGRSKYF